jgi:hypothetical protein
MTPTMELGPDWVPAMIFDRLLILELLFAIAVIALYLKLKSSKLCDVRYRDLILYLRWIFLTRNLPQESVPSITGNSALSILQQQLGFFLYAPKQIETGYSKFSKSLFRLSRIFRPNLVMVCNQELVKECLSARDSYLSPEPWFHQVRSLRLL